MATVVSTHYGICAALRNDKPTSRPSSELSPIANDLNARRRRIASSGAESQIGRSNSFLERVAPADWRTLALEELWRTHARKLLRIAQRITRNKNDAEDALQDSFLNAFVHFHDFDGRSNLSTWLTRIAINSALMLLRKKRPARELSIDDRCHHGKNPEIEGLFDLAPGPEAFCSQGEREALLREGLRALSPKLRRVIELQKLQERSLAETAELMGISKGAAKIRLYRAKASLREALKQRSRQGASTQPPIDGVDRPRVSANESLPLESALNTLLP